MKTTTPPRPTYVSMLLCGGVVALPLAVGLFQSGGLLSLASGSRPPGQVAYVLSKLFALTAFGLFWLQCALALSRSSPIFRAFPQVNRSGHVRLGLVTAGCALAHALFFFVASSARTGAWAWEVWVPRADRGFYAMNLSLGLGALAVMGLLVLAGWRTLRGDARWRNVHRLWPLLAAFAFVHAFSIGTASRSGAARPVFLFVAGSLALATLARLLPHRALLVVLALLGMGASPRAVAPGVAFVGLGPTGWSLYWTNAAGDTLRILTASEPRTPALSLSRKRVAYVSASGELREVDLTSGADALLVRPRHGDAVTQPAYAPGTDDLYVVLLHDGSSAESDIARLDRRSKTLEPVVRQRSAQLEPNVASDGRTLLYTSLACQVECGRIIQELWAFDLITRQARQLTLTNSAVRQPFESKGVVYFSSDLEGNHHIHRFDVATKTLQSLTAGEVTDETPVVDASGAILFIRRSPAGVALMRLRGVGDAVSVPLPEELTNLRDLRGGR
ncbi:MAG: hypothetical protein ACKVPX_12460 [Myxococcaceae bacterium]